MNLNSKVLILPKKIVIIYYIISLLLFIAGPIEYEYIGIKEIAICCIYMIAFLLMFTFAYKRGIAKKPGNKKLGLRLGRIIDVTDVVKFAIIYTTLVYLLLVSENIIAYGGISFKGINYYDLMAQSYTDIEFKVTLAGRLICYTAIFRIIAVIGGILFWNEISRFFKGCIIAIFVLIILNNTFFVGSQKQVIDLLLYALIAIIGNNYYHKNQIDKKTKLFLLISVLVALFVMGSVIAARVSLWEFRYNAVGGGLPSGANVKSDNFFYSILPQSILWPLVYLSGYFSQGYRGLALCLSEPFVPTWGMGFSFRIMYDFSDWFNIPISNIELSYPVRMENHYGIGAYSNWHTIFPWFASDITFFGSLLVVSLFVYLWAKSWRDWIETNNLWALILFAQLSILVLYIPCNNQLFQTRESILASIAVYITWKLFGGKKQNAHIQER